MKRPLDRLRVNTYIALLPLGLTLAMFGPETITARAEVSDITVRNENTNPPVHDTDAVNIGEDPTNTNDGIQDASLSANKAYFEKEAKELPNGKNIIDKNGGVDVKAYEAKKNTDGTWTYSYQITTAASVSSNQITTVNNFAVVAPSFAQNVEFRLTGTRDEKTNEGRDVDVLLGQHDFYKYEAGESPNRPLPSYQQVKKIKPGEAFDRVILRSTYNPELIASVAEQDKENAEYETDLDRIKRRYYQLGDEFRSIVGTYNGDHRRLKAYGFVNNFGSPMALKMTFIVTDEQVKKTPFIPIDVRAVSHGVYNPANPGEYHRYETGAQSLDEYRGQGAMINPETGQLDTDVEDHFTLSTSYRYIEHPELIGEADFDEHGLYIVNQVTPTRNSKNWRFIGSDIGPARLNYPKIFGINEQSDVTFVASAKEDYADIGVGRPGPFQKTNLAAKSEELSVMPSVKTPEPIIRSENVVDINGGVDVKPYRAVRNKDGSWTYRYQITTAPMLSTDHIQTANSFMIVAPKFVDNVKFKLIGTYDYPGENEEYRSPRPVNVNVELGEIDCDTFMNGQADMRRLPNYREVLKAGGNVIPNVILRAPDAKVDDEKAKEAFAKIMGGMGNYRRLKSYGFVNGFDRPAAIEMSFTVSDDQVKKTPFVPIDVRLAWRSFQEGSDYQTYLSGAQVLSVYRLVDIADRKSGEIVNRHVDISSMSYEEWSQLYNSKKFYPTQYHYIEYPELIKRKNFDEHGLYGAGIAPTRNTSTWEIIGKDLVRGGFSYPETFNLNANPAVTYIASWLEDYADIGVGMPEEVSKPVPRPVPKPEPKPTPEPMNIPQITPKQKSRNKIVSGPSLPKTGANRSSHWLLTSVLYILTGLGFISKSRKKES